MSARVKATFIPPMLLLRTDTLPNDPRWGCELKLDGYRAMAFKRGGSCICDRATTRSSRRAALASSKA
jgi:ATP-dependent DNA ligase